LTRATLELAVWPSGTAPKVTVAGDGWRDPEGSEFRTKLAPPQPDRTIGRQNDNARKGRKAGRSLDRIAQLIECAPSRFAHEKSQRAASAAAETHPKGALKGIPRNCITDKNPYEVVYFSGPQPLRAWD
jgi:hypothetical protein